MAIMSRANEMDGPIGESEPGLVLIISGHAQPRHKFRRISSQICATLVQSLLIMDLGMMIAVPTIVIGVLHNAEQGLSLDDSQSSWFVSIMLLCQPVGSVFSGCAQGMLGRKRSMMFVSLLHLIGWYLMYSAQSVNTLYGASLVMGVGIGFLEAPMLAYVGEISEPKLRGMLATFANAHVVIGNLLEFTFGYLFPWRIAMLVSCSVPVIATAALTVIPESPVWLLAKGRKLEALSSLRWLRGWVSVDEVSEEFHKLEQYCQASKNEFKTIWESKMRKSSGYVGVPDGENVARKSGPGFIDGVRDLLRPGIMKPLRLIVVYFFFYHAASLSAMRPFMIEVFSRLKVPISPNALTIVLSMLQGAGSVTCICLVHLVGKRALSVVSMAGGAFCCLSLAAYAYAAGWYSVPSIPLFLFCALYYCISVGISPIPWLLISEVFPTRGRGVAGGVCAAIFYIFAFLGSKTWLNLQNMVELHGCFFLYGVLGCLGVIYVFIYLPETEGKTLAEIEKLF